MAIDIKLQHGGACLTVTLTGSIGLTESREVLQQIVAMNTSSRNHPILLDVQATEYKLSFPDIVALVADLCDYRAALIHKTGILYNKNRQEKAAQFLELCAGNRGYPIRVFTVFEDAMKWLSNTTKQDMASRVMGCYGWRLTHFHRECDGSWRLPSSDDETAAVCNAWVTTFPLKRSRVTRHSTDRSNR